MPAFLTYGVVTFVLILLSFWSYNQANWIGSEPVAFFDGVSIWPTECIRVFAGLLGAFLLVCSHCLERRSEELISRDFSLPRAPRLLGQHFHGPGRHLFRILISTTFRSMWRFRTVFSNPPLLYRTPPKRHRTRARKHRRTRAPVHHGIPAAGMWEQYLYHASLRNRVARFLPAAIVYFLFCIAFSFLTASPASRPAATSPLSSTGSPPLPPAPSSSP